MLRTVVQTYHEAKSWIGEQRKSINHSFGIFLLPDREIFGLMVALADAISLSLDI